MNDTEITRITKMITQLFDKELPKEARAHAMGIIDGLMIHSHLTEHEEFQLRSHAHALYLQLSR